MSKIGQNIYVDIKDNEKKKEFVFQYLPELKEKYKKFNFFINSFKEIIMADKEYKVYSDDDLKVDEEIETIVRISSMETSKINGSYHYEFLLDNLNKPTSLKAFGNFLEKKELNLNDIVKIKGKVIKEIKKSYENSIKFKKYIIQLENIDKIEECNIVDMNYIKTKRKILTASSKLSEGFIDEIGIEKIHKKIDGCCFTDTNTLNFVMHKKGPLALKVYWQACNDKYYTMTLFLNSEDIEIDYEGTKLKVNEGIRALNEMISSAGMHKGRYVFDIKDIMKYKEHFLLGSLDQEGVIYQALFDGDYELMGQYMDMFNILGIESLDNLKKVCSEGRKNGSMSKLKEVNEKIRRLAIKLSVPLIFADNPVVLNKEDREAAIEFYISEEIKDADDKDRNKLIQQLRNKIDIDGISYIRTVPEVIDELVLQGFRMKDIEWMIFSEQLFYASLIPREKITIIPKYLFVENDIKEKEMFKKYILGKLSKISDSNTRERANAEYKIVVSKNYYKLFIAAMAVAKRSKELGYPVSSRGTAGSMLLCYLLGISDTNPMEYNLDYRMFLGPNNEKVPDIDINVSSTIVKQIIDELKKYFPNTLKASVISCYKENSIKSQILFKTKPDKADVWYTCSVLNGKIARLQAHNSGIMLLPSKIDKNYIFPTVKYDGEEIAGYPYEYLEKHIPKIDILSKNDIEILKDIETITDLESIDLNDPKIFELINKDSSEISELNTDYSRKIINLVKPKKFKDLITIQGLLHGKGILYSAEKCMRKNLTVISSRETLFGLLKHYKVENSFAIMEKVRKGNYDSLTDSELEELKKLPDAYREAISQIQYLFPKAHAISYAKQAYYTAYYLLNKGEILRNKKKITKDDELSLEEIDELIGGEAV